MVEKLELLIALINDNSNLIIIKTYHEENIFTFIQAKVILYCLFCVLHISQLGKKHSKGISSHVYKCVYWSINIG